MQLTSIPGQTAILRDLRTASTQLNAAAERIGAMTITTGGPDARLRVQTQGKMFDEINTQIAQGVKNLRHGASLLLTSEAGAALGHGIAYRLLDLAKTADIQDEGLLKLAGQPYSPTSQASRDRGAQYGGAIMAEKVLTQMIAAVADTARDLLP